ncbi:uracil-DNA glycosylase [Candidatus Pacearchaeota archaeon CG10_big_fil_rev_8_21_14_0_10_35_13]|nr:MAG: uracil-DNA glycosylase [Candidatus Pacearchaeota archaeon CG10_big_fil_rev_8_21_14_0_10_35_13]
MLSKSLELENVKEEIVSAKLPLHESATNLVFGKGNPEARIMFIGEAAGRNEDLQGMPFVGVAGKNLDKLLEQVRLTINDIYVANILKYRPPENRNPNEEEISAHAPYLLKQIRIIKPRVICTLGNYSTKYFLAECNVAGMKNQPGITQVHGKEKIIELPGMEGIKIKLIPLFHPAAIIYNRKLTELWEEDMEVVKKVIEQKELM